MQCIDLTEKIPFVEAFGMGKELSEMSMEELWELFPIFLVAHDDHWKDNFNEIEKTLTGLLANQPVVRISHYNVSGQVLSSLPFLAGPSFWL